MKGLNVIDVITPRDIYRCLVQDRIFCNFRDYDVSQTKRQVNAFNMSGLCFPPKARFVRIIHTQHGVSCPSGLS